MNPGDLTRFRKLAWAAAGALADLPFYAHPAIAEAECPMCRFAGCRWPSGLRERWSLRSVTS
jgi:hypothetical protein